MVRGRRISMDKKLDKKLQRKPEWFKIKAPLGTNYREVKRLMQSLDLHTVCQEANCPNRPECFGSKTATYLILGDRCTRGCSFCNVRRGEPGEVDRGEPIRVARASKELGLKYVVITSVTRDDLPDGGASVFADTIRAVREENPGCRVEVLIPDFLGNEDAINEVVAARPDVLNHNIETVRRLYPEVRKGADFDRSIELFKTVRKSDPDMLTKSGIMVGLGENSDEIIGAFDDLVAAGCRLLTIGQYLPPSGRHYELVRYYTPEEFAELKELALKSGFNGVVSGPLIRSSYQASRMFDSTESKSI